MLGTQYLCTTVYEVRTHVTTIKYTIFLWILKITGVLHQTTNLLTIINYKASMELLVLY